MLLPNSQTPFHNNYFLKTSYNPLISYQVIIHNLRYFHLLFLLETGIEIECIQKRLGHKSIKITSNVYSRISDKISEKSIDESEIPLHYKIFYLQKEKPSTHYVSRV